MFVEIFVFAMQPFRVCVGEGRSQLRLRAKSQRGGGEREKRRNVKNGRPGYI